MPTEIHVYLCPDNGNLPQRVSIDDWNAFERGDQPIAPINNRDQVKARQIKFLLMTIRDRFCEIAEPLCVDVDQFGFVQKRALFWKLWRTTAHPLLMAAIDLCSVTSTTPINGIWRPQC